MKTSPVFRVLFMAFSLCIPCGSADGQAVIQDTTSYTFGATDVFSWTLNGNTTVQPGTAPFV